LCLEGRCDHPGVDASAGPAWSAAVGEADWIGERLSPSDAHTVTSVVPAGFDAYARVLHPAEEPGWVSDRLVRWAEVAAWSGMSLRRDAQFHSIALSADPAAAGGALVEPRPARGQPVPHLSHRGEEELRDEISFYLTFHVIGLVGG
jgi:hypothetical protein